MKKTISWGSRTEVPHQAAHPLKRRANPPLAIKVAKKAAAALLVQGAAATTFARFRLGRDPIRWEQADQQISQSNQVLH
jgi:hypothetical protein